MVLTIASLTQDSKLAHAALERGGSPMVLRKSGMIRIPDRDTDREVCIIRLISCDII